MVTDTDKTVLEVRQLGVAYGSQRVLTDVSFRLERGEVMCVGGESGSGKSSLLKALLGFVDFEGEIRVLGLPLSEQTVDEVRRSVAYVPQELALPSETVREMVWMPFTLRANRQSTPDEAALLDEWTRLRLDASLLDKRVGEVSGGQRQRIMLAVAGLLGKPLLLVDEPTSALDEDTSRLVLDYFRLLAEERAMTVLVVSHSPLFHGIDKVLMLNR